jgi:hypothetical protein
MIDWFQDPRHKASDYMKSGKVVLNPKDNGGEQMAFIFHLYGIPDEVVVITEFEMQCYGNGSLSLDLFFNYEILMNALCDVHKEVVK